MTFTKDLTLRSLVSTYIYDLREPPTHKYFDYHWIGGVTETSATIKITLLPEVEHAKVLTESFYLIVLTDENMIETHHVGSLESPTAIHHTFKDLKPDSEYEVWYTLTDHEKEVLDQKKGKFKTFP